MIIPSCLPPAFPLPSSICFSLPFLLLLRLAPCRRRLYQHVLYTTAPLSIRLLPSSSSSSSSSSSHPPRNLTHPVKVACAIRRNRNRTVVAFQ